MESRKHWKEEVAFYKHRSEWHTATGRGRESHRYSKETLDKHVRQRIATAKERHGNLKSPQTRHMMEQMAWLRSSQAAIYQTVY